MATEGENQFADTDILIEIGHLANFSLHAQNLGKAKEVLTSLNVMRKYIYNFPEHTLCLKKRPFWSCLGGSICTGEPTWNNTVKITLKIVWLHDSP